MYEVNRSVFLLIPLDPFWNWLKSLPGNHLDGLTLEDIQADANSYLVRPCETAKDTMQTEIRNGTLYISGDVTVKTLTASAFARYEQQCRLKETDSIDFSQVGKADSACVSLLLNALRRTDKKPTIQNIPDSVRALAELYEIKDWLQS